MYMCMCMCCRVWRLLKKVWWVWMHLYMSTWYHVHNYCATIHLGASESPFVGCGALSNSLWGTSLWVTWEIAEVSLVTTEGGGSNCTNPHSVQKCSIFYKIPNCDISAVLLWRTVTLTVNHGGPGYSCCWESCVACLWVWRGIDWINCPTTIVYSVLKMILYVHTYDKRNHCGKHHVRFMYTVYAVVHIHVYCM